MHGRTHGKRFGLVDIQQRRLVARGAGEIADDGNQGSIFSPSNVAAAAVAAAPRAGAFARTREEVHYKYTQVVVVNVVHLVGDALAVIDRYVDRAEGYPEMRLLKSKMPVRTLSSEK